MEAAEVVLAPDAAGGVLELDGEPAQLLTSRVTSESREGEMQRSERVIVLGSDCPSKG